MQGISCARYWSLMLRYFYDKEAILVDADEEKTDFMKYNFPKEVTDDKEVFSHVA